MTSWPAFAAAQPDLAVRVRACFAVRKHATLATLRRDGSPRISGIEVEFTDDGLFLGSMAGAVKALDLLEVVHTRVGSPADHLLITSWHPGRGLQVTRRT